MGERRWRPHTREEYVKALKLMQKGLSVRKIAEMLSVPIHTLYDWRKGNFKPVAAWWEAKPSLELAYALGALLGDGTVVKKRSGHYIVRLVTKDYKFAYEVSHALSTVLCKPLKLPKKDKAQKSKSALWVIQYYSKAFYCWYRELQEQLQNGSVKRLRRYIEHNKNKQIVRAFLRGIFDAEGSHYYNGRRRRIKLVNTNLTLLRYIQHLLSHYFSIPSRIDKCGKAYTLVIDRKAATNRFLREVGFTIVRRQNGTPGPQIP